MATLIHKRRNTLSTQSLKRRSSRERRSGSRIAQAILLISFFILVGRFAYSSVSAFFHHQDKQQRIEQTLKSSPVNPTLPSFVKKE